MKKIVTVVFGITFLVLGLTACRGGIEYDQVLLVDAFLDATENMLDVMENDVIPAAEEMASAMKAMEESDLDPSSFSESQMKRIEEIEKKGESLDRKMQNMDIDLPF